MCLTLITSTQPRTRRKPLTVYKVVFKQKVIGHPDEQCYSPLFITYTRRLYRLGVSYRTRNAPTRISETPWHQGVVGAQYYGLSYEPNFHSYLYKEDAIRFASLFANRYLCSVLAVIECEATGLCVFGLHTYTFLGVYQDEISFYATAVVSRRIKPLSEVWSPESE